MTEVEWLACEEPTPMLDSVPSDASERKLQLFAVACCCRVRSGNASLTLSMAITAAAQHADGEGTLDELRRLSSLAQTIAHPGVWAYSEPAARVARAIRMLPGNREDIREVVRETCDDETDRLAGAYLLRDIFGNPFRPVTFAPEWRTDTAVALARQMYESREFSAMPILADALQDAGCNNDAILNHCRDTSLTHVRGCWVVDLVLGKE
jgi:hypothetical protein